MQGWGKVQLTGGTSTGPLTQLYPAELPAGDALPIAQMGTLRRPQGGRLGQISIMTDGVNGGTVELWDMTGLDYPADVSSATAITNAQLVALQARGKARLVWSQNFGATPADPAPWALAQGFMRGLAARYIGTGTCYLNLIAEGGYDSKVVPCGFVG